MYYNIPIEHLNNAGVAENETIPEAKYLSLIHIYSNSTSLKAI